MPVVYREGAYRFFFYSSDRNEPRHVHVVHSNGIAKFWLDPVRMQKSGGLKRSEISRVLRIIEDNNSLLTEAWDDYFNN